MSVWRYALSPLLRFSSRLARPTAQKCSIDVYPANIRRCINTSSSVVYSPVIPFNLPDVGEAIMTVIVTEWLVKVGDTVSMGDPICEVQSDKSSATIYCPHDGVVEQLMYEVDATATKDEPLVMIRVEGEGYDHAPVTPTAPPKQQKQDHTPSGTHSKVLATPAVRRIAADNTIDLTRVKGSGRDGRVLKEDILSYLENTGAAKLMDPPVSPPHVTTPPATPPLAGDRVEAIKGYKMIMVQTMTRSGQIPQFGYCDEIEMSQLMELRSQIKRTLSDTSLRFSYMPLMVKAVSLALREYPQLNAHVDADCTHVTYRADHNIGVAVDTPLGLVVPNVKQVQNKTVLEIARDLNRIHDLSLNGQLTPAEITGGTFSLSNIGAIGGTYTRPMLLPPEVCIGAFGKIQGVARFDEEGRVTKSHVMYVSWSADHRVVDGATVARFSNLWKSYLETPQLMLVDLK